MYYRTTWVLDWPEEKELLSVKEKRNQFSGINCINLQILKYKGKYYLGHLSLDERTQLYYIRNLYNPCFRIRRNAEKYLLKKYGRD